MTTPLNLRELSRLPERFSPGHRMCAGCGAPIVVKMVLMAAQHPLVVGNATGCLEVSSCIAEGTSWQVPWIHTAFENAAAMLSGAETMYRSLKKQGRIDQDIRFVAFGGDGGTADIGLQSLSGAMERGHDLLYICYDNGAYMNTGIQRSSATPYGADTTTCPVGSQNPGKQQPRKDLARIMAAHGIPYVAQASPSHWQDLMKKVRKALDIKGPKFINILAPCNRGWRTGMDDAIQLSRLAVDTCYWPLFEIENGETRITHTPREKKPLADFMKPQGRFKHLFQPGSEALLEEAQAQVDATWNRLMRESGTLA
nr:thiamine pyrophosphate-dependent enzyme [uncultured Holophaga sp.]